MPERLSTDVGGLLGEVKGCTCIIAYLSGEQALTGRIECPVEGNQKSMSALCQNDRLSPVSNLGVDL